MITECGATPETRFTWAMEHVLARPPTTSELAVLTNGLVKRIAQFQGKPEEASKLLAFGESKSVATSPELAAYAMMANVLLKLDELITRE